MSISAIHKQIKGVCDPERALGVARFFKTGKGEYGEGDKFVGVTVPLIRKLAKQHKELTIEDTVELLHSPIHEERLLALLLMVDKFKRGKANEKKILYNLYVSSSKYINNWDLVDLSASHIIGGYLETRSRKPLEKLAKSKDLWEKRMAIVGTLYLIVKGESAETLKIVHILINDKHDLIHKACGWMLREVGKRCLPGTLEQFLDDHASTMPRTMLRYAIERFPEKKRQKYLKGTKFAPTGLDKQSVQP